MSLVFGAAWQFSILGASARIVWPWILAGLAGVAVLALLFARLLMQKSKALRTSIPNRLIARMAPKGGFARDLTAGISSLVGLILLVIAASQPQCGTKTVQAKRYGMDVVIALDASNSMLARDVKPSRIDRAKLELSGLIDRLGGDRVGIVVFAGDAFVQCPLTTDYAAAKLFLRSISPRALPQQGTALAEALKTAGALFENGDAGTRSAAGRAVVVITDGEDHEGEVDEEAKKLADAGVRIFTVGVGSKSGEPIPVEDKDGRVVGYKRDRQGQTVMTRLNEEGLIAIAEATSGKYVHSSSGDIGVGEVTEELARMNKAEFETRLTVQYDDRFEYFAWPGFLLVAVGWAIGEGRFRRRKEQPA
jgi:Ca-activated chloride channel family protein